MCRAGAADIHARRNEFLNRGVRVCVVTSQPTGIDEFKEAVWQGGEVLLDEGETFKKALGGQAYKNRWLLRPTVIRRILKVISLFGTNVGDLNEKSSMLGGAMIVNKAGVLFAEAETSGFIYPSAETLLHTLDPAAVSCTAQAMPEVRATFRLNDKDGSEVISLQEFRDAMRKCGCDDEEINAAFASADADGSGEINYEEWARHMKE